MGMFDNVNFSMKCPKCGEELTGWQTKDGRCLLDTLEIDTIDNFYTSCHKCNLWYEFNRKRPRPEGKHLTKEEIAKALILFELTTSILLDGRFETLCPKCGALNSKEMRKW